MVTQNQFIHEEELADYLKSLSTELSSHHDNCDCMECRFDNLVIEGIEHIQYLFCAQILLVKNNKSLAADLMARSIEELVIDLMYIRLDIHKHLPDYLAFDLNCDNFFINKILTGKMVIEITEDEKTEYRKSLEKNLRDMEENGLPISEKVIQWTDVSLPDRLGIIKKSKKYPIFISPNYDMHIKRLHLITHCSGIQIRKRVAYSSQKSPINEPINWILVSIMIFLKFVKFHFNEPEIEDRLKKFHRIFYPEQYKELP